MGNAVITVRTLAAATALVIVSAVMTSGVGAQAAVSAPTPVVQGNRLVDTQTNATFVPHGVNIPGLEYSCVQGWRALPKAGEFAALASWKVNTVRLPLNESCWLGLDGAPVGSTVAQYKADVKSYVDGAVAAGLAVLLDLHWNAPAGYTASGQRAMPDERSAAFWTSVATTYAGNKSVMFELFNEPYSRSGFTLTWDCWKNGGCLAPVENDATGTLSGAKYTVTGMQTLVNAVRATGATQPILLGGLNYSNDLTGWIANKPTDSANQLVAAWHNYPGQGCSTTCWNSTITTVAASIPIVTTEFGNTAETTSTTAGDSHNYIVPFMTWADAHGIGYLPWAWWDVGAAEANGNGSDIYALYSGSGFTPKAPSGTKFHDYLAGLGGPPVTAVVGATGIGDFDRDGKLDFAGTTLTGQLRLYRGTGTGAVFNATPVLAPSWGLPAATFPLGDFNSDGFKDIGRTTSSGVMQVAYGAAGTTLRPPVDVSTGWAGYNSIIGGFDFDGDRRADVLARDSAGSVWLYRSNGSGGWISSAPSLVATGWGSYTSIFCAGNFDGQGGVDIIVRAGNGVLWLFPGTGAGGLAAGRAIDAGWGGFTSLFSPGNFDGQAGPDVFARASDGRLYMYSGTGSGTFIQQYRLVDSGWNTMSWIG